jgi:hypothetical protein
VLRENFLDAETILIMASAPAVWKHKVPPFSDPGLEWPKAKSHRVSSMWVAGDECLRVWQRMTAHLFRANFQSVMPTPQH